MSTFSLIISRVDCCSLSTQKSSRDVGRHNPKHHPPSTAVPSLNSRTWLPSAPPPVRAETMSPPSLSRFYFFLSLAFCGKEIFFQGTLSQSSPPLPPFAQVARRLSPRRRRRRVPMGRQSRSQRRREEQKAGGRRRRRCASSASSPRVTEAPGSPPSPLRSSEASR